MLRDRLDSDLKQAMRDRAIVRTRTLRSIRAALQEKEIEKRSSGSVELTDEEVVAVLQKQAKQRADSISQFEEAGRDDLVESEREELEVIKQYLPAQISDDEVQQVVEEIIADVGAVSMADMGKVMGAAIAALKGRAEGRRINEIARRLLSAAH